MSTSSVRWMRCIGLRLDWKWRRRTSWPQPACSNLFILRFDTASLLSGTPLQWEPDPVGRMRQMKLNCVISFLLLAFPVLAMAQASKPIQTASPQPPTALISPDVHADGSVTFRFRAPNAKEVKSGLQGAEEGAQQG